MPTPLPGTLISAKVRWAKSTEPPQLQTHMFLTLASLATHPFPAILEESAPGVNENDTHQVKLRVMTPPLQPLRLPQGAQFKLCMLDQTVAGEGVVETQ